MGMAGFVATAQDSLYYSATAMGNGSSGAFAPYFIGALNGGRMVRKGSALTDICAKVDVDRSKRFSWGAGAELIAGYSTANRYDRYLGPDNGWTTSLDRPSAIWIQQLYGELKFRGVFLRVGQKDYRSALLDERLSSGDLTRSSNARGLPGVELGFIDFQNIPFTNGWVQINGSVEYGKFMDNSFREKQFNHYQGTLTSDTYYIYRYCYFRTKPSMPLSVTVGMQAAGQFGGVSYIYYRKGNMYPPEKRGFRFKDIFKMFLPTPDNGDNFVEGNSLGSWDLKARYRLGNGDEISVAFEWPWEDGSGIGRMNGMDGLWGLYYKSNRRSLITGAAVEWLDFRNQSGPIHWAPGDYPGSTINKEATGADDYYNNYTYGAYTNYGMALATPFLVAPIYNLNGYPLFQHSRARGLHLALTGCIESLGIDYAVKYSWQQAWGNGYVPTYRSLIDNSMMLEGVWDASNIAKGCSLKAQLAFDAGSLRGNNFGFMLSVRYAGSFNFRKK